MNPIAPVFGFADLWVKSFDSYQDFYRLITRSSDVVTEIIDSTVADKREDVTVFRSLASVNLGSTQNVVILVGNPKSRGKDPDSGRDRSQGRVSVRVSVDGGKQGILCHAVSSVIDGVRNIGKCLKRLGVKLHLTR